jgi:hypothetical protein
VRDGCIRGINVHRTIPFSIVHPNLLRIRLHLPKRSPMPLQNLLLNSPPEPSLILHIDSQSNSRIPRNRHFATSIYRSDALLHNQRQPLQLRLPRFILVSFFRYNRSGVILDEYHFEPDDTKIGILLQTIAT